MSDYLLRLMLSQVWQIALLTVLVAFITRVFARSRPHFAHALWILVLVKCVTPPVWSHSLSLFSQLQVMWSSADSTKDTLPVPPDIPPAEVNDAVATLTTGRLTTGDTAEIAVSESAASFHNPSGSAPSSQMLSGVLLTIVTFGASLTFMIIVVRCIRCVRLIDRHRTTEFDDRLREHVQQLSARLRLRRTPRVVVSNVLFGPAVLGLVRQTIVLPRCLLESSMFCQSDATCRSSEAMQQSGDRGLQFLDPILAHELLHIRRGDLRTGALQIVVRSLWWFHPAVWLCNRWLTREAERCCDEQVIAELGCSPAQYARSLLSVIETKHRLQPVPIFPGMKPVEITIQRMERIMSLKNGLQKQTPFWCWLAIAIVAVFVLPGAAAQVTIDQRQDAEKVSENNREAHLVLTAYSVADLVLPAGTDRPKADYLVVAELIKSTIEPDSWRDDWGQIAFAEPNLSLVIRQTPEIHGEIAKLLSQLRNDQTQIQISAQILKISSDTQLQGVKSRCSLHPQNTSASIDISGQQQSWALLTPARSEQLLEFLKDEQVERLSAPKIVTISNQSAFVEFESINAGQLYGCRLDVKPHLVTGSSVIRLSHSVQIGCPDNQKQSEGELSIEECLEQKVSWHFDEVPFTDVIRHIAATHHVNISINTSEVRLPATQRVSLDAEGVTLKTALELLLDQVGDFTF